LTQSLERSGGQASPEDHKVSAVGDLTGLGVQVSTCLDKLGQNTDVFIDSLTPLFTMLRNDYIANFVHSVGAKTKGINGRFFYTLGTGIEKEGLNTIEAVSDCVIETSSTEESGEYRRRMRIKKMKKKHVETWTEFRVDSDKGIVFRSSRAKGVV
jgi:KaiC/GvpD/RAD55 family RecA-like ATPase